MATKRRNIFLYLAIVCFVGIIAIFIFDGYLGIYDTLKVTAGEREETIEPDFWVREGWVWSVGVNWEEKVIFSYEVDNRWFSSYSADVEVSVWRSQEKVRDLLSQPLEVAAFGEEKIDWVLDTGELKPAEVTPEQRYEYTVTIKRGEVERRIIVRIEPYPYPGKVPVPAPPR